MQDVPLPQSSAQAPAQVPQELGPEQQRCMVQELRRALGASEGAIVAQVETHISFVLVCAGLAYKIKKVLRTPFLDQSSLALRQRACQEELRLNRRLAPDLYLGVVPITGTPLAPALGGAGAPLDVAVQMRAFAQEGLWDLLAARGQLSAAQVDELVGLLGRFHALAAVADPGGRLGSPAQVRAPLLQSLDELDSLIPSANGQDLLGALRVWEAAAFDRLQALMARRLAQGRVRECHGDLHLGNVTVIDGHSTVFDGIEFSEDFRWIDVLSEVAFMAMDLHAHGLPHLAHRFVNAYLEFGGDYDGVPVLDYYLVHRALVRAKVHALRSVQFGPAQSAQAAAQRTAAGHYVELAWRFSHRQRSSAVLMLTHGFSGSGKSTLTQGLLEAIGAIRIRADVERKRLAGLQPIDRSDVQHAAALYGPAMTSATYARICQLAAPALDCGYPVILDATFLQRAQRDAARRQAAGQGTACVMLDFEAGVEELRRRLRDRAARGADASDADEAVLAHQMQLAQPLADDETPLVFGCTTTASGAEPAQADWTDLLKWLAANVQQAPATS